MMAKLIISARNPALNSLLTAVSARQVAAFKVLKQAGLGLPSRHPLAYVSDPSGVVFKQPKSSACICSFDHVDFLSTPCLK